MKKHQDPLYNFLEVGEQLGTRLSHSRAGRKVTAAVTGSRSPMYRQLNWQSDKFLNGISIPKTVPLPKDPCAPIWIRRRENVALLAARFVEVDIAEDDKGSLKQAVAFEDANSNTWHVGTWPEDDNLFLQVPCPEIPLVAVSMRLGKTACRVAIGTFNVECATFQGVEDIRSLGVRHIDMLPAIPSYLV